MVQKVDEAFRLICAADDLEKLDACMVELLAADASHSLVDVGIILRDHGYQDRALTVFARIMACFPEWVPGYYEAAFVHRLAGNHRDAVRLLKQAYAVEPRNMRVILFLIHMLHAVHAKEEGDRLYQRAVLLADDGELVRLEEMRQFGLFLAEWPKSKALALMRRNEENYRHAAALKVAEAAIQALRARQSFALIRLGDGEGSCINLGPEDEARFDRLYSRNRREFTGLWFGTEFPWDDIAFRSLVRKLPRIAVDVDFVGLPYEGWIEHEYRLSSLRGIPTLINIHRAFELLNDSRKTLRCCSQLIHVDLARSGLLKEIIRAAGQVSIISCLPEVADLIRDRLGIAGIEFYRIPGRNGSRAVFGEEIVAGCHFPDAFGDIMGRLERPHEGRLFLIAGGVLGKFYAAKIRQYGGVAMDIGSVVDGWAKKKTRPGMQLGF
jgi:tetratricopeptide (TPR) repeat protein